MFVSFIFLFRRELLIENESFQIILGISILLFIAGVVLHFAVTEETPGWMSGPLLVPLLSLFLFRLLRRLFLKWFKHEPRDTFFNWESGLGEDRVFNILYWILAFVMFMLAVALMEALTNAGW